MSNDNELVTNSDGEDRANLIGEQQLAGATAMDTTQQLMALLRQQSEAVASCMYEIGNMRMERCRAASTSTPNNATTAYVEKYQQNRNDQLNLQQQQLEIRADYDENDRGRNVDLCKWHVKFDGMDKSISDESFIFRIEKLRVLSQVSYDELFAQFHCLVSGKAKRWYWKTLEERENDLSFDYFALKKEFVDQYKATKSDYELIHEIMNRKQQPAESFEDYNVDIHNLRFKMKNKMPESELIKIIKSNVKPRLSL
uniref:Retrotrans_gag domain-containing protein n=1 Tax=Glossina brevipalpis TaxID=37001 RepID=A0A1A9WJV5_9MUSC